MADKEFDEPMRAVLENRIQSLSRALHGNETGFGLAGEELSRAHEALQRLLLIVSEAHFELVNRRKALEICHHVKEVSTRGARKAPEFRRFLKRVAGA